MLYPLSLINKYIKTLHASHIRGEVSGVSGVKSQDNSPTGETVRLHHSCLTIDNPVTNEQVFEIPCSNRFHLLTY